MKRPDGPLTTHHRIAAHLALAILSGCAAQVLAPPPSDPALAPYVERFESALATCTPASSARDRKQARYAFERALDAATHHSIHEDVDPDAVTRAAITGMGSCESAALSASEATDRALGAMVAAFDPDGSYLSPLEYAELAGENDSAAIGLEIKPIDNALIVVSPLPGSPAERAKIAPRDRILAIDGQTVGASDRDRVISRLRGRRGSSVAITVQTADSPPRVLTIEREITYSRSVWPTRSVRDSDGFAAVHLRALQDGASFDLSEELTRLAPLRGLVLDLRSNPGGLLTQAMAVTELFLTSGTIARVDARGTERDLDYSATRDAKWGTIPILVLVNDQTAAGAEIIAAALMQNGRAKTMGTHTFGRGFVQTIFPLGQKRALRLTTARLLTPNGTPLASGLTPDIVVSEKIDTMDLHTAVDTVLAKALQTIRSSASTGEMGKATPRPTRPSAP